MILVANMMTYNDEPWLDGSIPALQELCDRVIVQDNGSTDRSLELARDLARPEDVVLHFPQFTPPDYSRQRNNMLGYVLQGEWVLKWDPDELPSDAMRDGLRQKLEDDNDEHTAWSIPCYHVMKHPRKCLRFEMGFGHICLFRKEPGVKYSGKYHEQPVVGHPWGGIPINEGMAVIHFSYWNEKRFRKKTEYYATLDGFGFPNPKTLSGRLDTQPADIPSHVTYTASPEWLEKVRLAE